MKYGGYVTNTDDKKIKAHIGFLLFIDRNTAVYFDSFRKENISQEVLSKIKDKSMTHKIFRIQDDDSVMYGLYCTAFIEYMIAGKTLLDYTNLLFS